MDNKNNSNKLKLRIISTIFRSSCRDRSVSDTAMPAISNPKTTTTTPSPKPANNKLIPPPTPNPPTSPLFPCIHHNKPIIKPSSPCKMIIPASCYKPDPARQKLCESYSLFYSAHSAPLLEKRSMDKTNKKKKKKKPIKESNDNNSRTRRVRRRSKRVNNVSFWSSSDEEEDDDEARLVGSWRRRAGVEMMKKKTDDGENNVEEDDQDISCYAVVKCSRDPYMDFRTSMVEMIVEKKMEKAEDLERLLQRFLKLNSYRHHPVIIEAFMEIWDALF